jgi:hypothetical protein
MTATDKTTPGEARDKPVPPMEPLPASAAAAVETSSPTRL